MNPDLKRGWIKRTVLRRIHKTKDPYLRDFKLLQGVVSRQVSRLYELRDRLIPLKETHPRLYRKALAAMTLLGIAVVVCLSGSVTFLWQGSAAKAITLNIAFLAFLAFMVLLTLKRLKP